MTRALKNIADRSPTHFPCTIYYAFKQSDSKGDEVEVTAEEAVAATGSSGWETFLNALV